MLFFSFFAEGINTAIGGIKRWADFCFWRLRSHVLPYTLGHQTFASITWKSLSRAERFYSAPQQICPYDNWARQPWGPSFLCLIALTACVSRKFKNLYCLSTTILKEEVSCYLFSGTASSSEQKHILQNRLYLKVSSFMG